MLGRESVETAVECFRNRFLKIISVFKNTYEGVYFSVESKEYITGKSCNRLHKTSCKLTINWNILFARYLLQDSGTSYGKLLVKVISCCNNLQEQRTSFLQARCKGYRGSYGTASYRKK